MLKNILYSFYTSRTLRSLIAFVMVILLGGCEDGNEVGLAADDPSCWQSEIIHEVLKIVDDLYKQGFILVSQAEGTSHIGADLLCVAFAVWMGFKLLKVITSFKEESLGEVWTEIFQKLFLCAFCAFLITPRAGASSPVDEVLNYFVLPIYQAFIELGLKALSADTLSLSIALGDFGSIDFSVSKNLCSNLFSFFTGDNALAAKVHAGDLHTPILKATDCIVCEINDRLNSGYKVGISLITSLSFGAMLVGFLVVFLFTVAKFGFVLYLVDSVFRLNFAVFLFPALIMGVPFNYTRRWSKHGFLMFINSSGIMFFMALLVNICASSMEKILNTIQINSYKAVSNDLDMFAIFLIALLMVNLPGFAVVLANKFIGGGNGQEFNKKISQFLSDSMKKLAGSAINTMTSGATNIATKTMEKYETSRRALDHIKQAKHSAQSVLNSLAGYNDDDNS